MARDYSRPYMVTPETIKEWVAKYKAGASIRNLAEEYNRAYGTVHRRLTIAGVQLRGRNNPWRRRKR